MPHQWSKDSWGRTHCVNCGKEPKDLKGREREQAVKQMKREAEASAEEIRKYGRPSA